MKSKINWSLVAAVLFGVGAIVFIIFGIAGFVS